MSTYTPVASQTLSASASSVTFSNIPQGYTDLVVVANVLGNVGYPTDYAIGLQVNGDTGSNYSDTRLYGNGTSATSDRRVNATLIMDIQSAGYFSTTTPVNTIIHLMNYSNTTTYKTILSRGNNATGNSGTGATETCVGLWRSTSAITSVKVLAQAGNFGSGTIVSLYGIQAGTPKAQGGQIVTTDGTYWYHTFTASGTFTPSTALSCDYLVVAGGGSGGSRSGQANGGGGAGGYRTSIGGSQLSLTSQAYPIIIGAGGASAISENNGNKGSDSSFSTITSTGGGYGGRGSAVGESQRAGGPGGSGGGAGSYPSTSNTTAAGAGTGNQGSYSPVEGYNGGNAKQVYSAAGGGGSSAVGGDGGTGAGSTGGNGGAGTSNSISGSAVTYAGGGAGSGDNNGTGGSGGGGNVSTNGTANTGGGGGAGSTGGSNSGSGGSGVVIIRYAV